MNHSIRHERDEAPFFGPPCPFSAGATQAQAPMLKRRKMPRKPINAIKWTAMPSHRRGTSLLTHPIKEANPPCRQLVHAPYQAYTFFP